MADIQDLGPAGAQESGAFTQWVDSRIGPLMRAVQQMSALQPGGRATGDPLGAAQFGLHSFNTGHPIQFGKVVASLGFYNWYRVQVGGLTGSLPCCMLSESSFLALGVRSTSPIPPGSSVLVYVPTGLTMGVILGALPGDILDGDVNIFNWLCQGSNTGIARESGLQQVLQLSSEGGVRDYSCGRPWDGTSLDWGKVAASGIALLIDDFQAFLRVNEACGLFLNHFDSYCRLAGIQFDLQTFTHQIESREDEGECLHWERGIVYPWEALGLYKSGTEFTKDNSDKDVLFDKCVAKIDLNDQAKDIEPVARYQEFGGYLGQGRLRMVSVPAKEDGMRKRQDGQNYFDVGVFQEAIGLDGSYGLRSAKGIYLVKRLVIPSPMRLRTVEDGKGDDAKEDNYKFSGKEGGGDEHKVKDFKLSGDDKFQLRTAMVMDLLAHHYNWKLAHPFHYHKKDWKLADESKVTKPTGKSAEKLEFGKLADEDVLQYPEPKKLKVDHRYGEVEYYQRESFFVMHEDGAIHIGDGSGSEIVLAGGQISLRCPGDILLLPGKRVVQMAWDLIMRAKNSVDISATEKDVRIKAEKNMQFLAGNGKSGGMLFECKSEGTTHQYKSVWGEDVKGSGIVFVAKKGQLAMLGKEILLRTGGGKLEDGDITIDASKGKKSLYLYGESMHLFAKQAINIWHSPSGESCSADANHMFSKDASIVSGMLIVEKDVIAVDGNGMFKKNVLVGQNVACKQNIVTQDGSIVAGGNIIAKQKMAQKGGGMVGDSGSGQGPKVDTGPIDKAKQAKDKHKKQGDKVFNAGLKTRWYTGQQLGSEKLLEPLGFSFRDVSGNSQYKTNKFKLLESRWQQMTRLGAGSGGKEWTEKAVKAGGKDTYPWPGKQKWKDDQALLQLKELKLYDGAQGQFKTRGKEYEEPEASSLEPKKLDGTWKLVL